MYEKINDKTSYGQQKRQPNLNQPIIPSRTTQQSEADSNRFFSGQKKKSVTTQSLSCFTRAFDFKIPEVSSSTAEIENLLNTEIPFH